MSEPLEPPEAALSYAPQPVSAAEAARAPAPRFYAFGFSESNVGIYYNKKMFKEAGIEDSELPTLQKPWTWDEFKAISKKLTDHFKQPAIDFRLNSIDDIEDRKSVV